MTNAFPSLDQARSILAEGVLRHRQNLPRFNPMNFHPWLAMSLMQKAIRRGREDLALRASATLLGTSPERFWRRIGITAYEDIGVADTDTVAFVTAALKGKRWRADLGGEWAVASYLVERMARTVKCRAADDLAVVCQWHPSLKQAKSDYPKLPASALLDVLCGDQPLTARALSLWYAVGTDRCRSPVLPIRNGTPDATWKSLIALDISENTIEIAREAFRKTNSILCPFCALVSAHAGKGPLKIEPDDLPHEEMIDDVPCWAFDVHVREGTHAISRFLRTECETAGWITRHIPPKERFRVMGSMLFRIESGMVDHRLQWESGNELRRMADLETGGVEASDMQEGLRLFRDELHLLNRERHYAWSNAPKNAQLSLLGIKP